MRYQVVYWEDVDRDGFRDGNEPIEIVLETEDFTEAVKLSVELFNQGEYHTSYIVDTQRDINIPVPLKIEDGKAIAFIPD